MVDNVLSKNYHKRKYKSKLVIMIDKALFKIYDDRKYMSKLFIIVDNAFCIRKIIMKENASQN